MIFFKKYLDTGKGKLVDSIVYDGYIYSAGFQILNNGQINGIICKHNLDGSIIFSKSYRSQNRNTRFIRMIISEGGDLVVCGNIVSENETFVAKFSLSNGSIVWNKSFPNTTNSGGEEITWLKQLSSTDFLFVNSDENNHPLIHKFSFEGVHIISKSCNNISFLGLCINPSKNKIIIFVSNHLFSLDVNLNTLAYTTVGSRVTSGEFVDDKFFVYTKHSSNELSVIKMDSTQIGIQNIINRKIILNTSAYGHKIIVNAGFIYLSSKDFTPGITKFSSSIFKFDTNLNLLWAKRLDSSLPSAVNIGPTAHLNLDGVKNSNILLRLVGGNTQSIVYTDLLLSTCLTVNNSLNITTGTLNFSQNNPISTTLVNPSINSKIFSTTNINLNPLDVCTSSIQIPDLNNSTITAVPSSIPTGGGLLGRSEITVQLYDTNGIIITNGTYDVHIVNANSVGTLGSTTPGSNDGEFKAELVSSNQVETAVIGFRLGSVVSDNYATVDFIADGAVIDINENTSLQSPHIYLQAAGSNGEDSTKGRHLRWAFRGALGEKHLPKGNNAVGTANFNKPQDFVTIYRAGYKKKTIRLNFAQALPAVVDHSNYLWIYRILGKEFYIRFGNATKYDFVKNNFNPLSQPYQFLNAYGNELVEIENIKELFFTVTCNFSASSIGGGTGGSFKVETLSVEKNTITSNKIISNRRIVEGAALNAPIKLVCENGRSLRWRSDNINIASLDFEFYLDTITEINVTTGWETLGDFALTLNDETVFQQFEPTTGDVHGVWQRFNDDAFVNINNYQDKWNGTPDTGDRNIKQTVTNYINLSNSANNPTAIEEVPLGNDPNDPNDYVSISNLDLLNLAANDYHVARLLGLGILDIDSPLKVEIKNGEKETQTIYTDPKPNYLYVAEYYTTADLEDGLGARNVHHLFMSLPTTNADTRLSIPVNLSHLTPGVFLGGMGGELSPLTDVDGYTHDGLSRYISIYSQNLPSDEINPPFLNSLDELSLSTVTTPVYGGLEHRIGIAEWDKPELSNDPEYYNVVSSGTPHFETRFILIPDPQQPFYVHRQTSNGLHTYSSYGINWFSRASARPTQISINTLLTPTNPLRAPINTQSLLIRSESPLFLTSRTEQDRLEAITIEDKTLIRLFFNYHHFNELKSYKVPLNSPLSNNDLITDTTTIYDDNDEIFADKVEILFRDQIPQNIRGKVLSVEDHPTYEILSVLTTGEYYIASTGVTIFPIIPSGGESNFIGGVIVLGSEKFIIHEISTGISGPIITVYKKQISDSITGGNGPTNEEGYTIDLPITNGDFPEMQTGTELISPTITGDGYFMAIENMQNLDSWGIPNPLDYNIKIGIGWNIHREVLEIAEDDGNIERYLEKSRGIFHNSKIDNIDIDGNIVQSPTGLYKIEFTGFTLNEHIQYAEDGPSVEFSQGVVRIFTENSIQGGVAVKRRKTLPVLNIQNIIRPEDPLPSQDLILIVEDTTFDANDPNYDVLPTGSNINVNFYPGYKVYLYKNREYGLTEDDLLPDLGEGMRYSIFGFRSVDVDDNYISKISAPAVMFAQEIISAEPPLQPQGPLYATRPDFFGRSTYTFETEYTHQPHGVLFYRSNDEALLNAIYEKSTILQIRTALKSLGGNDEEWLTDRWANFIDFNALQSSGFQEFPPTDGYKFPNPDKQAFFDWANKILIDLDQSPITDPPGSLTVNDPKIFEFFKGAIYSAFVPLTELPILYQYLNGPKYQPINKKQVVKDSNGYVIPPVDPKITPPVETEFDMAPMMKIINDNPNQTLFTDFNLDGTSNNLYFYGARELGTKMKMSDFSPFLGPIKLVNTNAPEAPAIKRIVPVLENAILGTPPEIRLEVNAYAEVQNIRKLTIYRGYSKLEAQSIRTMQIVNVIDLVDDNQIDEPVYIVKDDFNDLLEVPYSDPLFYRVTVSREVEYADAEGNIITEYAPSQPSKIVASLIVEVSAPSSPNLKFLSTAPDSNDEIHSVTLKWSKTAYKAKYHIYKMNNQGNWYKIYQLQTNDNDIQVSLNETELQNDTLVLNEAGQKKYHHFKVIAENTAGMLSKEEKILTIFNEDDWIQI